MINKQPSMYEDKYGDVPSYLMKYRKPEKVRRQINSILVHELIVWAEIEYHDTKNYYESIQDYYKLNILKRRSQFDVLASSRVFMDLCRCMTQEEWDSLPKAYKKLLARVYKLRLEKYVH